MYTRTRGSTFALQMKFGITHSPLSYMLRLGMAILVKILRKDTYAAVRIPTDEEIRNYQDMIQNRHTLYSNIYLFLNARQKQHEKSA